MQAAGEAAPVFAPAAPRFDAKWLIIAVCVVLTLAVWLDVKLARKSG